MGKSPCLHEDLSLNLQQPWKRKTRKLGIAACDCNTRIVNWRQADLGSLLVSWPRQN